MVCLLILSICLLASTCQAGKPWYHTEDAEQHFEEFIVTYNKTYNDQAEKNLRFLIFKENLMIINTKNSLGHDAIYGITKFTDLTREEVKRFFHGLLPQLDDKTPCLDISINGFSKSGNAPASLDWREKNKVTRVKNQGNCGSCWAFSTIGNVEGQYAIKHNKLVEFSEQQLVDCDTSSNGCYGGWMVGATMWLSLNGGSMTEQDYMYEAIQRKCRHELGKVVANVTGCSNFRIENEDELKQVLAEVGPLALAIDAEPLIYYSGGIITCPRDDKRINHAVLLVGYGKEGDKPYWLLKNSWSEKFGEDGYFRLEMYKNSCNMLRYIVSAEVA